MTVVSDSSLRSLIQLLAPARALREDVEKAINLELCSGTGDFVVKSFQSIQSSVYKLTNEDPFVGALSQNIPDSAGDKEKYSMVLFSVGQLIAYIESQVGVTVAGASGGTHYQIKPLNIGQLTVSGSDPQEINKIKKMLSDDEE